MAREFGHTPFKDVESSFLGTKCNINSSSVYKYFIEFVPDLLYLRKGEKIKGHRRLRSAFSNWK